jgi:hypothetical protein
MAARRAPRACPETVERGSKRERRRRRGAEEHFRLDPEEVPRVARPSVHDPLVAGEDQEAVAARIELEIGQPFCPRRRAPRWSTTGLTASGGPTRSLFRGQPHNEGHVARCLVAVSDTPNAEEDFRPRAIDRERLDLEPGKPGGRTDGLGECVVVQLQRRRLNGRAGGVDEAEQPAEAEIRTIEGGDREEGPGRQPSQPLELCHLHTSGSRRGSWRSPGESTSPAGVSS